MSNLNITKEVIKMTIFLNNFTQYTEIKDIFKINTICGYLYEIFNIKKLNFKYITLQKKKFKSQHFIFVYENSWFVVKILNIQEYILMSFINSTNQNWA